MSQVTSFVICFVMGALRSRLSLQLEVAALRHQLSVYRGAQRRPPISSSDRLLWSMIASVWSGWRKALFFVQPRTVLAWQHKRFRDHWRGLSGRGCRGRPSIPPELRRLIRQMWQANPTWGSPRRNRDLDGCSDTRMKRYCSHAMRTLIAALCFFGTQARPDMTASDALAAVNLVRHE